MTNHRLMPERINLGQQANFSIGEITHKRNDYLLGNMQNPHGHRELMHFLLPTWQRGLVWTQEQKIKFIESAWLGLNLGTYTFNRSKGFDCPCDNLLVDGQQRMSALSDYLDDKFKVFGYQYSEITDLDNRSFDSRTFTAFIIETDDEEYLKRYYNLMNFGGTAHKIGEEA